MADSRGAIEEIRQRVGIVDVVSEYVAVKRTGKSYKGLCPFHSEKTPSFTVSDEFQTWHCFGCGEHGDVFSFLMRVENLTFPEVLERLAKRAGVELEPVQARQSGRKQLLAGINSMAAAYYSALLKRTPIAMEYLRGRGLADQTIEQFRLGYAAPAWDGLVRHLTQKGVDMKNAAQAGLVIQRDRGGYYDRFRHRIVFPIFDIQERVVGFGGRAMGDDEPKYLNSPETPLFSKAGSLYGLSPARKSIADNGHAIVVEGYMDVITAHQAGFSNCVATLGTALTLEHIKLLSRYAGRVVLAYDADSAGMAAALKGAAMFGEVECDVRIARLPSGDDPDSLLREGRASEFADAVSKALPVVDCRLAILEERHDLSGPAGRAAMLKEAMRVLAEVPSSVEREKYIRSLARYHPNFESGTTRAEDHIRADIDALMRHRKDVGAARPATGSTARAATALEKAESAVLRVLICDSEGADAIIESLDPEDFGTEMGRAAAKIVFGKFCEKKGMNLPEMIEAAGKDVGGYLSGLAMRSEEPLLVGKALEDCVASIKNSKVKKMRTSDVLAAYIKQGVIESGDGSREQTMEELQTFLRKSGKLPGADSK